nr:uncharacterized protein LOC114819173 isoform X4 [Malus domestica]
MVSRGFRFLFFWNFCLQLWKTFVLKQKLLLEFSSFYLQLCKLSINKLFSPLRGSTPTQPYIRQTVPHVGFPGVPPKVTTTKIPHRTM